MFTFTFATRRGRRRLTIHCERRDITRALDPMGQNMRDEVGTSPSAVATSSVTETGHPNAGDDCSPSAP